MGKRGKRGPGGREDGAAVATAPLPDAAKPKTAAKAPAAKRTAQEKLDPLPERRVAAASALGAIIFVVYLLTLYPSVPPGDSGELIGVSYQLGVAHPPGYPLYTLLAKLFTLIPHGTIAWRVNVLSAACDAGAVAMLCLAVTRLTRSTWAGVVAGGAFGLAPVVWACAVMAEVFPLNNSLLAALLYSAVRYTETKEWRIAKTGALLAGLGLANHHAFVFFAVPLILGVLWVGRKELIGARPLASLVGFALLGLSPYLYLPLAARRPVLMSWGDAGTWDGFWRHLLREDFGTFKLGATERTGQLAANLGVYFADFFAHPVLIAVALLALAGTYFGAKNRTTRTGTVLVVAALAAYLLIFFSLSNLDIELPLPLGVFRRFWQQPTLMVCALAGLGFGALERRLPDRMRWAGPSFAVALVIAAAASSWKAQDQSANHFMDDYARAMLLPLPPQTLLLTVGDLESNTIRYLQICEGVRPDVKALDRSMLGYPWSRPAVVAAYPEVVFPEGKLAMYANVEGYRLAQLFKANSEKHPIFIVEPLVGEDKAYESEYVAWPYGFLAKIEPKNGPTDIAAYVKASAAFAGSYEPPPLFGDPTAWERYVAGKYWDIDLRRSMRLILYANEHGQDATALNACTELLEAELKRHPDPPPPLFKNLGLAYYYLRSTVPTADEAMRRYWQKYVDKPSPTDAEVPQIRQILATH